MQLLNAIIFEHKGPESKPCPREKPPKSQENIRNAFLNALHLPRKHQSRNLLLRLLPDRSVLEHRVLKSNCNQNRQRYV